MAFSLVSYLRACSVGSSEVFLAKLGCDCGPKMVV